MITKNQKTSWPILLPVLFLLVFGLVMIGDVSLLEGETNFNDKFHFLKHQLIWSVLGLSLLFFTAKINYQILEKWAKIIFIASLIPLILIFVPGMGINAYGAKRWLNLGFFSFQPTEIIKLSSIIYFSSLLSHKERRPLWQQIIILAFPLILIIAEPNFSSAVLIAGTIFSLWFLAKENLAVILLTTAVGIGIAVLLVFSSPYRKQRVVGFIDPFYDPYGKSYHAYQMALTIGSGSWFGQGMGNSRQKYQYLPEVTADSIIALVAEEFGFIGITVFLAIFTFFITRCFYTAASVTDKFGQLLAAGITILIAIQGVINLGATSISLPLTGMPFPFVSYGGSSLVILLISVGILINIFKKQSTGLKSKRKR